MGSANGVGTGRRAGNSARYAPKPGRMARAIRGALTLTTVALAMTGSGTLLAAVGTCTPPVGTVNCDGVFNDANTNVPLFYAVEDLTVIIGALDPATTVTDNFTYALSLTGTTGYESLYNHGVITNNGIYAVTVATGSGDITIDNANSVVVYGGTFGPSTYAIHADSASGTVVVDNLLGASISATNSFGNSTGIDAYSQYGNVNVLNAGDIYTSASGNGFGIYADSEYGVVDVTSSGTITANGNGFVYGIYAHSYDDIFIDNQNSIITSTTASGFGTVYGVFVYTSDHTANNVTVDNSGYIGPLNTGNGNAYGL